MATPSLRTKILVARGTYSNLNASVSDLGEGEICYATDQDKLYVKEGGVLTGIGGDVVSVNGQTGTVSLNIDNLTDVDTTTVAPTSGQLLSYNGAQWTPTDAPVPVAGSDTQVQFNDTGVLSGDTGLTFDATTNELTVGVSNADPGTATVKGDLNLDSGGNFSTTIQSVTPTANRTISFPDKTGTVGLVSGATGNIQYNSSGALAGTTDLTVGNFNWTDPTVTYTGLKFNVTETGSAAASRLLDIQRNGGTVFSVDKNAGARASTFYTEETTTNGIVIGNYAGRGIRLARDTSITFHATSPTTTGDVGFKRDSAGIIAVTDGSTGLGTLQGQLRAQGTAPASATAAGTAGDIRYDSGFIYVCTATNTWVRAALSTF